MFTLSSRPLEHLNLKESFANPKTGALVTFEGVVRNHNEGRKVVALEYEASESFAQKESQKILAEVKKKFQVSQVKCIHRVGKLTIGETAVWIGVSAAHRDEAFKACRYLIDEIKERLPIWKKEYYENGDSGWVNSNPSPTPGVEEVQKC
jgi:molybdopterin synthase catalytic subunit